MRCDFDNKHLKQNFIPYTYNNRNNTDRENICYEVQLNLKSLRKYIFHQNCLHVRQPFGLPLFIVFNIGNYIANKILQCLISFIIYTMLCHTRKRNNI